jgi:hypothetical protein
MPKSKTEPSPTPTPVVLVVLPDEIARQIHRQLTQLDRGFEADPAAPRPSRTPPKVAATAETV